MSPYRLRFQNAISIPFQGSGLREEDPGQIGPGTYEPDYNKIHKSSFTLKFKNYDNRDKTSAFRKDLRFLKNQLRKQER